MYIIFKALHHLEAKITNFRLCVWPLNFCQYKILIDAKVARARNQLRTSYRSQTHHKYVYFTPLKGSVKYGIRHLDYTALHVHSLGRDD